MGNAASSFCTKIGSGLGTAALGFILELGQFNANPTGAASLAAIRASYIWVPGIMTIIMLVCLVFLKYDKEYNVAVADLEQGKWKGSDK
jgi:GPH family glycoside/pentoside/hexuronide:cation symporter